MSAAMRYVIADKYDVDGLKNAAWDLIDLALALIRAGAESFEDDQPYRAEEVTRNSCEAFFLELPPSWVRSKQIRRKELWTCSAIYLTART